MTRAPRGKQLRAALAAGCLFLGLAATPAAMADNTAPDTTTGWLLPLPAPSGSQQSSPPSERVAGDAVTVESPESVDEAIALLTATQEAQAVADAIVKTLASAQVELAAAVQMEQLALEAAQSAAAPVAVSEDRVGVLAAQQYMAGGASDWAALLYAETPQDAIDVMTFSSYMDSVSNNYLADVDRARANAQAAEQFALDSTARRVELEAQVQDLEQNLANAQLTISTSIAAYQAYISRPGPQTRIGTDGCPLEAPANALRGGAEAYSVTELCRKAVAEAASPQAALAIKTAFSRLGAPYACEGVGRLGAWRFDCSSLVSRAYSESSGIPIAGPGWAPSTRDMIPWDGVNLDEHLVEVSTKEVRPGDLLLYRSCTSPPCSFQHVVMALADGFILHTNDCGDIAHITRGAGYGPGSNFVVARRVVHIEGESLLTPTVTFPGDVVDPKTFLTKRQLLELQERQAGIIPAPSESDSNASD